MPNLRFWRAVGVGVPVVTILVLLGIFNAIFPPLTAETNLFNSGISVGTVLALANILVVVGITKHYI